MANRQSRRAARDAPTSSVAQDSFEVRIFTLCDHVAGPPDGKLYINGAGVDQIFLPQIPGPLTPLGLAVRIRIPWNMTSEQLTLRVRVLDADRHAVGPDPVFLANLEVGRPPGLRPGDEIGVNAALGLAGLPVPAEGSIYFHLIVAEQLLGILPLKVRRLQLAQPPPGV